MNVNAITLPQQDVRKLLGAANADAALLYLYIAAGNDPGKAGEDLHLPDSRLNCAGAILAPAGPVAGGAAYENFGRGAAQLLGKRCAGRHGAGHGLPEPLRGGPAAAGAGT